MKENNKLEKSEQKPDRHSGINRTLFKDTLTRALLENDGKRLRALSEKLFYFLEHEAIQVQDFLALMKFLAERTDGRAHQMIEITGQENALPSATMFKLVKVEANE
jgi:hypothetical protein